MDNSIEQLKEEARKLLSLLEDPQPGLFTWNMFLEERMKRINEIYQGK